MTKNRVRACIFALLLPNAVFCMEEDNSQSVNYSELSGFKHDGSYRLSAAFIEVGVLRAQTLCLEHHKNPQELSELMVGESNNFEESVALLFLKYRADPSHALKIILSRAEIKRDSIDWVVFLLRHGACVPAKSKDLVVTILGKGLFAGLVFDENESIAVDLNQRFDEYNSNGINIDKRRLSIQTELHNAFLLAVGRGRLPVIQSILKLFGHCISDDLMREAFALAAYGGHSDILEFFYHHNKARTRNDRLWGEALSSALQDAALRAIAQSDSISGSSAFDYIMGLHELSINFGFKVEDVNDYIKTMRDIPNTPDDILHVCDSMLSMLAKFMSNHSFSAEQMRRILAARKKGPKSPVLPPSHLGVKSCLPFESDSEILTIGIPESPRQSSRLRSATEPQARVRRRIKKLFKKSENARRKDNHGKK